MRNSVRNSVRAVTRGLAWSLLFLAPAATQADWLILRTGERVETKGPWTIKGKQVVYTTSDKLLRSIRASEVDLTASAEASAVEPASQKKHYQDMGEAPDIATVKPPKMEFNRLNAWISNPNAPRVSGTISTPKLAMSEIDLVREGLRILQDPEAIEAELMQDAAQVDAQYTRCREVNSALGKSSSCDEDFARGASALSQRVETAYIAVAAARDAQTRAKKMQEEDDAETLRIDREREKEERAAEKGGAKAPAADDEEQAPR